MEVVLVLNHSVVLMAADPDEIQSGNQTYHIPNIQVPWNGSGPVVLQPIGPTTLTLTQP